jgi:hypothetical protein
MFFILLFPRITFLAVLILSVLFPLPAQSQAVGLLEDPGAGSFQSGIALIRGWVCAANLIEIQIDDDPRIRAAYPTTRPDTQDACGDDNNGFGLTWNWNRSGDGIHRVRAYADGVLFGDVMLNVATFGQEFLRDKSGECTVNNFPDPGQSAGLVWQQSIQNFVVRSTSVGEPQLTISRNTLDFDNVTVGLSEDLTFTVTNSGGRTLSGTLRR